MQSGAELPDIDDHRVEPETRYEVLDGELVYPVIESARQRDRATGRAEGKIEALLGLLAARELVLDDAARARITGELELAQSTARSCGPLHGQASPSCWARVTPRDRRRTVGQAAELRYSTRTAAQAARPMMTPDTDGEPARAAAETAPAPAPPLGDRKARAARIQEILDRFFPEVEIPLDHGNPFQLLVATILSAQCTDARVNMVTPALFARAPDAPAMAGMTAAQIMPYIKTCGLAPAKAKALAGMSRILMAQHGGQVPRDMAALEELPGVGHKTASVVMAQAFGEPAFPVDTHIHRLAGRWQLSRARTVEEVERDLKAVFPRERWTTLHLQIIYFGRQYCPARQHDPAACPICSWAMSKARAEAEVRQGLSKPVRGARPGRERKTTSPGRPAAARRTAKRSSSR